jgi:hypothetical protein
VKYIVGCFLFCYFQLLVSGLWHTRVNGVTESSFQVKRFQGIGKYTKSAKVDAAKKAMTKLRSYMPGLKI